MPDYSPTRWRVDTRNTQRSFDHLGPARDYVRHLFETMPHLSEVIMVKITMDPTSISRHELKYLDLSFPISEKERLQSELFDIDEMLSGGDGKPDNPLADPAGIAGRRRLKIMDRLKEIEAIAALEAELAELEAEGDDGPADVFADRRRGIAYDLNRLKSKGKLPL